MFFTSLGLGFLAVVLVGVVFVNTSSQFGSKVNRASLTKIESSVNYKNGKFVNLIETPLSTGKGGRFASLIEYVFTEKSLRFPERAIETLKIKKGELEEELNENRTRITWFGHSSVLVQNKNHNVLIDPMFSVRASPIAFLGPKKFDYTNEFDISNLPEKIDVVLISHDHYDHLDYESIVKLKDKVEMFYVPLGVKAHLLGWDVDSNKVQELDWYESSKFGEGLRVNFTPTRHFSGRGLMNGMSTLWGSWVVEIGEKKIYFSADGGYSNEFKKIGEKYGPFDLAFIECGAYSSHWKNIHMKPEQSLQAGVDLKALKIMPIHWSKFGLSFHGWREPIERFLVAARDKGVLDKMVVPRVFESFILEEDFESRKEWWEE